MGLIYNYYPYPDEYPEWLKEDIKETIKYFELPIDMTPEQLKAKANDIWQRARWMYEEVNQLESRALILERIARDKENFNLNWMEEI